MKKTLSLSVCAVLVSATMAFAADDAMTAEGTGTATVAGRGEEKAFEEAKKLALRDAVEKAAGVIIQSDSMTLNSQLVRDRVFANSQGYVKKHDVVSKKVEKNVMTVVVRAEVGKTQLDQDLVAVQGLIKRMGKNKLIIVMNEQSVDEKGIASRSETLATALTDIMKTDGWRIIDEKGSGDSNGAMKVASAVAMGVPDAKDLARKADADYILYGSVSFRYQPPGSGIIPEKNATGEQILFFVTGEYDMQMFEVSTGRQLAKVAGKFDQKNMNQIQMSKSYAQTAFDFCKRDSPRIVGELRNPVLEYLRNQDVNGAELRVKVSGLKDFGEVSDFETSIEQVANVRGATANGDFEKGAQEFEVNYLGKAQELGKALITTTFKKKKLTIVSVKNNILEVAIAK